VISSVRPEPGRNAPTISRTHDVLEAAVIRSRRSTRFLACAAACVLGLAAQQSSAAPQETASSVPADLRAALQGTWQLEEWHVDGRILRPPQADGRWSLHDGVVLFTLHRADSAESSTGYGEYRMDASTWAYGYTRMQRTTGPLGGPVTVAITPPAQELRSFTIRRGPGGKVTLDSPDAQHEYEGPFFTLRQKGQIVRKWRRIEPGTPRR
jgi:hypothetical protein